MPVPIPPAFPRRQRDKPLLETAIGERAPEWIEVVLWRYEELKRAGYPAEEAMTLSVERDVDLHQACELIEDGCLPEVAARILL